jgi:hypothetical protein
MALTVNNEFLVKKEATTRYRAEDLIFRSLFDLQRGIKIQLINVPPNLKGI